MPYDVYKAAYKEALACATRNVAPIDTIEVTHTLVSEPIRLCTGGIDRILTIDGNPETFTAAGFGIKLPDTSDDGFQDLQIVMDNIDLQVSDFLESVAESADPIIIKYRPFLSNDDATEQSNDPLELELRTSNIGVLQVTGSARVSNMSNKPCPRENYTHLNFPNLRA